MAMTIKLGWAVKGAARACLFAGVDTVPAASSRCAAATF
jgi:hypothetical protein